MSKRPPEGAWYGRSPERYVSRGAEVFHDTGGWYARVGWRVRGPLACMQTAMEAADEMLERQQPQEVA